MDNKHTDSIRIGIPIVDYLEQRHVQKYGPEVRKPLTDSQWRFVDKAMSALFYTCTAGFLVALVGILGPSESPKEPTPIPVEAPTSLECGK